MDQLERITRTFAIEALNAAFAYHLDHQEAGPLSALFTPNGVYANGTNRTWGRDAIERMFIVRWANCTRTTRHLYSGLRIRFEGESHASSTSVWMAFARNSAAPVDYTVPNLVADFEDVYHCGQDGEWHIESRLICPVFRDPAGIPPATDR